MCTILLHSAILIDHRALAEAMPLALAHVMADRYGGGIDLWRRAYEQVALDWDSYWIDLDLSGDNSLQQWREGRWRIVRAHFRLAGQTVPTIDQISLYLDVLPRDVGRRCAMAWQGGVVDVMRVLAEGNVRLGILAPFLSSSLVWGLIDAIGLDRMVSVVLGPDELDQAGTDGLSWSELSQKAGSKPGDCVLVSNQQMPGARIINPPSDLSALPSLLPQVSRRGNS